MLKIALVFISHFTIWFAYQGFFPYKYALNLFYNCNEIIHLEKIFVLYKVVSMAKERY